MALIDRDRLLTERMKSKYYHLPNGDIAVPLIDIEHAPVVDAVPVRRGYWIRHDYADLVDGYYVPNYECSVCHAWKQDDSDYCPDCGAKMDGKGSDNG